MSALKPSDVRRSFSPEFKWQVVQESKARLLSASALARKYDVNTNQLFRWVRDVTAQFAIVQFPELSIIRSGNF